MLSTGVLSAGMPKKRPGGGGVGRRRTKGKRQKAKGKRQKKDIQYGNNKK